MTRDEIHQTFNMVIREDQSIKVITTAYRGHSNPNRPDKKIGILCGMDSKGDEFAVLVGDKGRSGPSLLKTGPSSEVKKFKANAFFSLRNAGFDKERIDSEADEYYSARGLWQDFFEEFHRDSEVAKIAFLNVIGIDTGSSFAEITRKAPPGSPAALKKAAENPYEGNPLWGLL